MKKDARWVADQRAADRRVLASAVGVHANQPGPSEAAGQTIFGAAAAVKELGLFAAADANRSRATTLSAESDNSPRTASNVALDNSADLGITPPLNAPLLSADQISTAPRTGILPPPTMTGVSSTGPRPITVDSTGSSSVEQKQPWSLVSTTDPAPGGLVSKGTSLSHVTKQEEVKAKESVLTDRNMVYMGCAVQQGRGTVCGVVVSGNERCLFELYSFCACEFTGGCGQNWHANVRASVYRVGIFHVFTQRCL